ncbi:translation initiation factor eIF-2B subunit alpha [Dispira simplex]|nr:translation initiation factor eIF-2B subunit alpha [Dispira simplex]
MTELQSVVQDYKQNLAADPDMSMPVAAVKALVTFIQNHPASTMVEFVEMVKAATQTLKESSANAISLSAGCDLFMQAVTRMSNANLEDCRDKLINKGTRFVEKASSCRESIAALGVSFIRDNGVVLVHSYSRVVMALLLRAASQGKRFRVYVTESRPTRGGARTTEALRRAGVPCTEVLDCTVSYIVEQVDCVLFGAEGVVENGGIINQIGSYQVAIVAKAANKPVYAVAESYKFVRLFPLNQFDLPTHRPSVLSFDPPSPEILADEAQALEWVARNNPSVDYTPPSFITLLFTDLGVLTPSGVSDELIKLYY